MDEYGGILFDLGSPHVRDQGCLGGLVKATDRLVPIVSMALPFPLSRSLCLSLVGWLAIEVRATIEIS